MNQVKFVSFEGLIDRLVGVLGEESLLYQRFEHALRHKDDDAIEAAMQSLNMYPDHTKEAVQDAMLSWLFDQKGETPVANLNSPSNTIN